MGTVARYITTFLALRLAVSKGAHPKRSITLNSGITNALTFASFVCLLWLTGVVMRLPKGTVPLILKLYLIAHIVFLLGAWLGNQQWSWYDKHYVEIYTVCAIPVFVSAILLTMLTSKMNNMGTVGLMCVFIVAAITVTASVVFPREYLYRLLGVFVGVFIGCGLSLFLTMASNEGPIWETIKITLGCFWLIEGMMHWAWGAMMARGDRQDAMVIHRWAPALVAIFAFWYLGWSLSQAMERETSRTEQSQIIEGR